MPDYCIKIGVTGTQLCQVFSNATGLDGEGEPVVLLDGVGLVRGCDCLFDAEVETVAEGDPDSVEYQEIMFRLEASARQRCLELAVEQELLEHNCVSADIEGGLLELPDSCTAGCVFANPPPGRRCAGVCNPDDDASGESSGESGESDGDSSGTETGPGTLVQPVAVEGRS